MWSSWNILLGFPSPRPQHAASPCLLSAAPHHHHPPTQTGNRCSFSALRGRAEQQPVPAHCPQQPCPWEPALASACSWIAELCVVSAFPAKAVVLFKSNINTTGWGCSLFPRNKEHCLASLGPSPHLCVPIPPLSSLSHSGPV